VKKVMKDSDRKLYSKTMPKKYTELKAKVKQLSTDPKQGTYLYSNYTLVMQPQGFVEEFWTKQRCTSVVLIPGTSLLSSGLMGVCYLLTLGYLFLGIAIVSDIFMEAIEEITA